MHRKAVDLAVLAVLVAASACAEPTTSVTPDAVAGPEASLAQAEGAIIPGEFIIELAPGSDPIVVASAHGVSPRYVYRNTIRGFADTISEIVRSGMLRDMRIVNIEPNRVVTLASTQTGATWGLDRTDQRALPLSGTYTYANTGAGVNAYIVDTGILYGHTEFGGRAVKGYDAVTAGGTAADCNGHGTHVAGTVGGAVYGVAKAVNLIAVRVLDCGGSGSNAGVIAGVDWVTANHVKPAVANMSLGGGASTALDNAVNASINAGVTYAVAAGNGNFFGIAQDACKSSPARVANAITIGASDKTDKKASFSNYGNCVDFFGPGVGITSAWYTSTTATNTISGTSMAAPHVAGVAALYLQSNPTATPAAVRTALFDATTKGVVTSAKTTNNHLLFSNY